MIDGTMMFATFMATKNIVFNTGMFGKSNKKVNTFVILGDNRTDQEECRWLRWAE